MISRIVLQFSMASVENNPKTTGLIEYLNNRVVVAGRQMHIQNPSLTDDLAFYELGASSKPALTKDQVIDALAKMKRINLTGLDGYAKAVDLTASAQKNKRETVLSWSFHFPFFVNFASIRPFKLTFPEQVVQISSTKTIAARLGKDALDGRKIRTSDPWINIRRMPKFYLSAQTKAPSLEIAFSQVYAHASLVKAIFEIALSWNTRYLLSSSARAKIVQPPWVIIQKPDAVIQYNRLRFPISESVSVPNIDALTKQKIKFWEKLFSTDMDKGDIRFLIADATRLYSRALDQVTDGDCLIGFWQVLESITLSQRFNGDTSRVVKHVAWHTRRIRQVPFDFDKTLSILADKRNDLVHRGVEHVSEEDISILKFYCELGLSWIMRNRRSIPTVQHLEDFYRTMNYDEKQRNRLLDVLRTSPKILEK